MDSSSLARRFLNSLPFCRGDVWDIVFNILLKVRAISFFSFPNLNLALGF
jgi:hypothetical protein